MRTRLACLVISMVVIGCAQPIAQASDDCHGNIGGARVEGIVTPVVAESIIIPITDPGTGPFYLDVRYVAGYQSQGSYAGNQIEWIVLYAETNGTLGLQRGDWGPIPTGIEYSDPCVEAWDPDWWVF